MNCSASCIRVSTGAVGDDGVNEDRMRSFVGDGWERMDGFDCVRMDGVVVVGVGRGNSRRKRR